MKAIHLLAATFIFVIPATAHADWQYTKWGMTPEQVQKASKGVAVEATSEETEMNSSSNGNNVVKLTAPYTSGEFQFKAFFGFDKNGKLGNISLKLIGGDPHALIGALHDKYGKEEREPRPDVIRLWTWVAPADRVSALMIGDDVTVSYGPLHTSADKGL